MSRKSTKGLADLDRFSQERAPDILCRWNALDRQRRDAELMLRAGQVLAFDADELAILDAVGFLCGLDRDVIKRARQASAPLPTEASTAASPPLPGWLHRLPG